jgi:hypothetical protein
VVAQFLTESITNQIFKTLIQGMKIKNVLINNLF